MRKVDLSYQRQGSPPATEAELLAIFGPAIEVQIGFDPGYDPLQPQNLPNLAAKNVRALIDTGATLYYIDERLAKNLGLVEIDKETVIPAHGGTKEIVTYLGQIYIPSLSLTVNGRFGGVDSIIGSVSVILGREFLMNCNLSYDGITGQVSLSV